MLVKPHGGGPLKPLLLSGPALEVERSRANSLPQILRRYSGQMA